MIVPIIMPTGQGKINDMSAGYLQRVRPRNFRRKKYENNTTIVGNETNANASPF